jgi:hypothetical protein
MRGIRGREEGEGKRGSSKGKYLILIAYIWFLEYYEEYYKHSKQMTNLRFICAVYITHQSP